MHTKELKTRHENLHLVDMDVTDYSALPGVVKQVVYIVIDIENRLKPY